MAHFAELDENNVVVRVLVVPDHQEHRGNEFLAQDCGLGGRWLQTSYTSREGRRVNPETGEVLSTEHFRFNYAAIGGVFDESLGADGAFVAPQPGPWHVLNPESAAWEIPPGINPSNGEPWGVEEMVVQELLSRLPINLSASGASG